MHINGSGGGNLFDRYWSDRFFWYRLPKHYLLRIQWYQMPQPNIDAYRISSNSSRTSNKRRASNTGRGSEPLVLIDAGLRINAGPRIQAGSQIEARQITLDKFGLYVLTYDAVLCFVNNSLAIQNAAQNLG